MKTFVSMVKRRFVPMVLSGRKRHTVRPTPKRMPQAGDMIDLREWTGKPYRSKQRRLMLAPIERVAPIVLREWGISIDGVLKHCNEFAIAYGFESFAEMLEWFRETHGLPFSGNRDILDTATMKTFLYAIATMLASLIMWLVTHRFVQLCDDIHAMARDIQGIRRAIEHHDEPRVMFRMGESEQPQEQERMLL